MVRWRNEKIADEIAYAPMPDPGGPFGVAPEEHSPDPDERVIQEQLIVLGRWVLDNANDARRDRIRFWMFKIPALIGTTSTSALEVFGYGKLVVVFGVVSALCVGIDALFPGGHLHNVHRRAVNEIRELQNKTKLDFDTIRVAGLQLGSPERIAEVKRILQHLQAEKTRISAYITAAEASLGESQNRASIT